MNNPSDIQEKRLRKYLKDHSHDLLAKYKLATILEERGSLDEALSLYKELVAADPNFSSAYSRKLHIEQLLREKAPLAFAYTSPPGADFLGGPFLLDEERWIVMQRNEELALLPVALRFGSLVDSLKEAAALRTVDDLRKKGYKSRGTLRLKKNNAHEAPPGVQVELGKAFVGLFSEIVQRAGEVQERCYAEMSVRLAPPVFRISDEMDSERYRILRGDHLLAMGGMKSGHLFLVADDPSAVHDFDGIEALDEHMGIRGLWIRENRAREAFEQNYPLLDAVTLLLENVYRAMSRNLALLWTDSLTRSLIDFVRGKHPLIPWKGIEENYSPAVLDDLVTLYLRFGGSLAHAHLLFDRLAEIPGEGGDPRILLGHLDDLLHAYPGGEPGSGNDPAICLSAALNDRLLFFLSADRGPSDDLLLAGLPDVSQYILHLAKNHLEEGRTPFLLCLPELRPLMRECLPLAELRILSTNDISPHATIGALHDVPPELHEKWLSAQEGLEKILARSSVHFHFIRQEELILEGAFSHDFAVMTREGKRSFLFLPGVHERTCDVPGRTVHHFQEQGYLLEGLYNLTFQEGQEIPEKLPETQGFLESPVIEITPGIELIGLMGERELGIELVKLIAGVEQKYGLKLPAIHCGGPAQEDQPLCIATIASKHHQCVPSVPAGTEGEGVITGVLTMIRGLIEDHLADLVSFETASQFIQKAAERDTPVELADRALASTIKGVLKALVAEKIPCTNARLILKASRDNVDMLSPEELAESLRRDMREEILEDLKDREGKVRAAILSDEMEIILSTSFFQEGEKHFEPSETQEWNYVSEVLVREYRASGQGRCIICSRALRRMVRRLMSERMPTVAVLARDEVPGDRLVIEGEIAAPEGFRKFIIDESLKLGIMNDYEDQEEKARSALRACFLRERTGHRRTAPPARHKNKGVITLEMGKSLSKPLDNEREGPEFTGFVLFLRQWLERSRRRDIPDIRVSRNDDIEAWSMMLHFPGQETVTVDLPPHEFLELWPAVQKGEKGALRILGAIEGKGRRKNSPSRKREKSAFMPLSHLILMHLFTAMMNMIPSFSADADLEQRVVERAIARGFERPSFTSFFHEAIREGIHPLEIEESLCRLDRELTFLGREARIERLRSELREGELALLYGPEKTLTAAGLLQGIESFFLTYLREIGASVLTAAPPPSVAALQSLAVNELFLMMEQGFSPLLITERLDEKFVGKLVSRIIPQARVLCRSTLPFDAKIKLLGSAGRKEEDLFSPLPTVERKNPLLYLSSSNFYLFCALMADYEGEPESALGFYEKMRYLTPAHPTALWRGAFCYQRMGNARKSRDLRRKARLYQKSIHLSEPGYYAPDDKRIGGEVEIQRLREQSGLSGKTLLFRQGYCAFQEGDIESAQTLLQEVLKEEKYDDEVYLTAAHILAEGESYQEALPLYMKALRLNPYNLEVHQGLASALAEESNYTGAVNLSRRLVRLDGLNKDFIHDLGMASQDMDDYQTMLTCAEALLTADRQNSMALYMRSRAFHHLRAYDREIIDLQDALKLKPDSTLYNRTLGNSLWSMGLYDRAVQHYEQALLGPDESESSTFHRIKIMSGLGDSETASRVLDRALKEKPRSSMLLHLHGELLLATGALMEAQDAFRKAKRINPSNLFYQLSLAETLLLLDAREEAEATLNTIVERNPAWVTASLRLAGLRAEKGHYEESRSILRKAMEWTPGYLELYTAYFSMPPLPDELSFWHRRLQERSFFDPHNPSFHFVRALLFGLSGDYPKAAGELEKAYLLTPESIPVVEFLCRMLMAGGDFERPLVVLRVAMKKILRNSRLFFIEGMCWRSLGNIIRARESFKKASMYQPLHPYACTARGYLFHLEGCADSAAAEAKKALRYDRRFSPALLLEGVLRDPEDPGVIRKAKECNPLEVMGFR
jgi:flagellar biosynthesis component FlhA/Flp pilus assembly protein TadD